MSIPHKAEPLVVRVIKGYHPDGAGASSAKHVLQIMATWADQDGTNSFLGQDTIASYARMSLSTVKRAIAKLESDGVITRYQASRAQAIPADKRPVQFRVEVDKLKTRTPDEVRGSKRNTAHHDPTVVHGEFEGSPEGKDVSLNTGHGDLDGGSLRPTTQPHTQPHITTSPTSSNLGGTREGESRQEVVQGSREDEEVATTFTEIRSGEASPDEGPQHQSTSFTESQSSTDIPSSLQAGNLYADKIEADSVTPEEVARRRLARLNMPWVPDLKPYMAMMESCPDVNVDAVITTYNGYLIDEGRKPRIAQWTEWIERRQRNIDADRREREEIIARKERRGGNWITKTFGDHN